MRNAECGVGKKCGARNAECGVEEEKSREPERRSSRVRRHMVIALRIFLIYLAFVLIVYLTQRRLLYFPSRESLSEVLAFAKQIGLEAWPEADEQHRGFMAAQNVKGKPLGTIVVCHGNAGSALNRFYYADALNRLGYRVLLAEYPGYGARAGKCCEKSFVEDTKATLKALHEQGLGPILLWGESLGCGVVAAVASDPDVNVVGLVLLSPWDSLPNLAQKLYWYLPAKWLVKDKYDSVANLSAYSRPVAILMAEEDEIIPNACSMRLYESLNCPKKLWTFPDAGHNSWPVEPGLPWWGEVVEFVRNRTK